MAPENHSRHRPLAELTPLRFTQFRHALARLTTSPVAEDWFEATETAAPIAADLAGDMTLLKALRGPTITIHEFLVGVEFAIGRQIPFHDGGGGVEIGELRHGLEIILRAAVIAGPSATALLAQEGPELGVGKILDLFDRGPERFASRRYYGQTVPAQRLRHLLETPLEMPDHVDDLLGEAAVGAMPVQFAWLPGEVRLPRTLEGNIALFLSLLPPTYSPDQAVRLLNALCAANKLPQPPSIGPLFADLRGLPADREWAPRRVARLLEWLQDNLPPQPDLGLSAVEQLEAGAEREKALVRLLSKAERMALELTPASSST